MAQNTKDQLIEYLKGFPDDVSFEDIMYHLYVKETILQRMEECNQNPSVLVSEKDIEEEIQKWFRL
jgi:hypothetical protein